MPSASHRHDDAWIEMTAPSDLPHRLRLCNRRGLLQVSWCARGSWRPIEARHWIFSDDEIGVQFMDDAEEVRTIEAFEFSPRELRLLDPQAWGQCVV